MTEITKETIYYPPSIAGNLYVEYGDAVRETEGMTWGIRKLDETLLPARPPDMTAIIARPGQGKSTIASIRCKRATDMIARRNKQDSECVLYVSLDQPIEQIYALVSQDGADDFTVSDFSWGKVSHEQLVHRAMRGVESGVWMIGRSITKRTRPKMTFSDIFKAAEEIDSKFKIRPIHLVIDYIQIAQLDYPKQSRTEQVSEATIKARELAVALGCTIDLCVQAGRDVDKYGKKIPTLSDCQWSSGIEQEVDRAIAIWRPSVTEQDGEYVDIGGTKFQVTKSLFVMKNQKQRMEDAGITYVLNLEPSTMRLFDIERFARE